jgi:hypothetical protein
MVCKTKHPSARKEIAGSANGMVDGFIERWAQFLRVEEGLRHIPAGNASLDVLEFENKHVRMWRKMTELKLDIDRRLPKSFTPCFVNCIIEGHSCSSGIYT